MTPIQAQVSMYDLYVLQKLGKKVSEEALEVSKMWQDYQESSIVTEGDKKRKMKQDVPPETRLSSVLIREQISSSLTKTRPISLPCSSSHVNLPSISRTVV